MLRSELLYDFLRSSINMATDFKSLSESQCLFASVIPQLLRVSMSTKRREAEGPTEVQGVGG